MYVEYKCDDNQFHSMMMCMDVVIMCFNIIMMTCGMFCSPVLLYDCVCEC